MKGSTWRLDEFDTLFSCCFDAIVFPFIQPVAGSAYLWCTRLPRPNWSLSLQAPPRWRCLQYHILALHVALHCYLMFNFFLGLNVVTIERLFFSKRMKMDFVLVSDLSYGQLRRSQNQICGPFPAQCAELCSRHGWVMTLFLALFRLSSLSKLSVSSRPLSVCLGIRWSINNLPYAKLGIHPHRSWRPPGR